MSLWRAAFEAVAMLIMLTGVAVGAIAAGKLIGLLDHVWSVRPRPTERR